MYDALPARADSSYYQKQIVQTEGLSVNITVKHDPMRMLIATRVGS